MKKVSLLLLLAVISILFSTYPLNAFAQVEDYLDETLKLSQKEGSNEKLKEYFSGIDARSDTLYAYLYIPGRSPRLEGYVYSFDRLLKHASPGAETVIISVEQDADAARLYNERQGYKADHYIYDEEQRYLDFISINSIGLRGTYVLKVALSSGRLICGGAVFSTYEEYFDALVRTTEPQPYCTYAAAARSAAFGLPDDAERTSLAYSRLPVETPADVMLGELSGLPAMKGGTLLLCDELNEGAFCFKRGADGVFRHFSTAGIMDDEKYLYFKVSGKAKDYVMRHRMDYYMLISVGFLDGGDIGLSYSIPFVCYNEEKCQRGDSALIYFNQPIILVRDSLLRPCAPMKYEDDFFDRDADEYIYSTSAYYPLGGDVMALSCWKMSYPIDYFEEFNGIPEQDPFMDEFYGYDNPYLVTVDMKSGRQLGKYGELPDVAGKTKTGYYFCHAIADGRDGEIVYGDSYSGNLFLAPVSNPDDVKRTYKAFSLNPAHAPVPDESKFRTMEYAKYYSHFYQRQMQALRLTDKDIHCVMSISLSANTGVNDFAYEYVRIERESGDVVSRYVIDKQYPDEEIMGCNLTSDKDDVRVFYMSRRGGKYAVVFVDEE